MTNTDQSPITRYLRRMLSPPCAGGLSDAQLLERFLSQRDEAAFEVLVWRHGPMVLGVCRRILRHEQDAEDAFQATFLVLVRKASSIGKRQTVGAWLYRVAFRVALRAKMLAEKRTAGRTPVADLPAEAPPDLVWRDLRPVLDEEVNRLPEKYRAPFILCYLAGKTNEQAAQELGCPKGTVLSRLAWARQRLRVRLTSRGLALSAGLVGAALVPDATAAVPAALVAATRNAGLLVAAGQTAAVSGPVAVLTEGVIQTMLWNKARIIVACVLAVGVVTFGGGLLLQQAATSQLPSAGEETPDQPEKQPKKAEPKEEEKTYAFELRDKPWASVLEWYTDLTGLPFISDNKPQGTVTFIPPKGKRYTLLEIGDLLNELLEAQKLVLFRRQYSFTLIGADEKIDDSFRIQLLGPEDLDNRLKQQRVTVRVRLTKLKANDVGPEVKKMLGPFGSVTIHEKANELWIYDTVGILRLIHQTIKDLEAQDGKKPSVKSEAPKPEERTFAFEVRDMGWAKILEWYSEISGLPFVGSARPKGTFTFIPPKGGKRKYTLAEITDILNEMLQPKHILVVRHASFTVAPADERIDRSLLPHVRLEDLPQRGKTELVVVVLPLTSLKAKEIGAEVKKMMGPFGEVVILEKFNQLLLQDTAGNLRVILGTIQEIEAKEADKKPDPKGK